VELGDDGTFTYTYTPNETGTYTITAEITPENGITFSDEEELTVDAEATEEADDDGGSAGGYTNHQSGSSTTSSSCSPDWDCGDWSECSNSNKYRTCSQNNCGDKRATKTERRACYVPKETEPDEDADEPEPEPRHSVTSNDLKVNDTDEVDEDPVVIEDERGSGLFGRVGRAFGFLTGAGAGLSLFIIMLVALALVAVLFTVGWSPSKKEEEDLFGDYFEKRNR
jgi:hypothetical protein